MSGVQDYVTTGDPVVITFDALPDLARVLGIGQSQIDLVAEPFDGYVYAIRPAVPIFEAVRWPANEAVEPQPDEPGPLRVESVTATLADLVAFVQEGWHYPLPDDADTRDEISKWWADRFLRTGRT